MSAPTVETEPLPVDAPAAPLDLSWPEARECDCGQMVPVEACLCGDSWVGW